MTAAHVVCADLNKFAINSSICLKSPPKWETIAVRVKFLERKSVFLISILSTAEKGENKWSNGALNSKTIKNNDNSIQFELSIAEQLTFISFRFVLSRSTSPICHEMLLFSTTQKQTTQTENKVEIICHRRIGKCQNSKDRNLSIGASASATTKQTEFIVTISSIERILVGRQFNALKSKLTRRNAIE